MDRVVPILYYFKEGFRIPVSPFVLEVLGYYKIHVSQLTPNAVGRIIGFEVLCRSQGRACTVGLFRYFFQMKLSQDWYSFSTRAGRPELLVGFPESIKGWKEKFFFVKTTLIGEVGASMRWRGSTKVTDHKPAASEYDEGSIGRVSSLMLDIRDLKEPVLQAAALSPFPIERAGQLTDKGQCMCPV